MIGQEFLWEDISSQIDEEIFPRFSLIVGPKGSGKKILAERIGAKMQAHFYPVEHGVDAIRAMIKDANKIYNKVLYCIFDADTLSPAARSALLKVTEEPPNNAYIIMTLEDANNTLDTIRSRAVTFQMERYTPDEILEYAEKNGAYVQELRDIIADICETPGEVNVLIADGVLDFYDYVETVLDNVAEVSLANALKISNRIKTKEDAEGYDLRMFWKATIRVLVQKARQESEVAYSDAAKVTSRYLQELRNKSVNRQMLFDNWILSIREVL